MLNRLNTLLNRLSMYKVLSVSLTILFVFALILSLAGSISYSPMAMVSSFSVLGLAVYLGSVLFGLLFSVRIHAESSYITSSILFFIFTPTLTISGLLILTLVGLIAAASKFLLVFRGRHIFNAAAMAAFIVSLTGLTYPSWWVATPPLAIITFVLGFLIIQKTRRIHMSGIFIALSILLITASLISYGSPLDESILLLLSWPILFFSSFMLTEPLTLPPKKWQQITEAVVVAIVFSLPFHVGEFTTTPALALLIGNFVAFCFKPKEAVSLRFKQRRELTPTSYEFIFSPTRTINHEAGQYIEITIPHKHDDLRGMRRSFSITSAPGDETIKLGIKFYEPPSSFKKTLKTLTQESVVRATSIAGDFTLPKDSSLPLLFIAGGIGITPFISHLNYLRTANQKRDIVLIYAVSSHVEVAYKDILINSGIKVFIVTSDISNATPPHNWQVIDEAFITSESLRTIPDITHRNVYISGPPQMIDATKKHLKKLGVKRIKTDYFIGY